MLYRVSRSLVVGHRLSTVVSSNGGCGGRIAIVIRERFRVRSNGTRAQYSNSGLSIRGGRLQPLLSSATNISVYFHAFRFSFLKTINFRPSKNCANNIIHRRPLALRLVRHNRTMLCIFYDRKYYAQVFLTWLRDTPDTTRRLDFSKLNYRRSDGWKSQYCSITILQVTVAKPDINDVVIDREIIKTGTGPVNINFVNDFNSIWWFLIYSHMSLCHHDFE